MEREEHEEVQFNIEVYCASIGRFYNRLNLKWTFKKKKVFKGAPKKCDFIESINFNIASDPKIKNSFLNKIQPISFNIIKPW